MIRRILPLLMLLPCLTAAETTGSVNVSHPLVMSFGMTKVSPPLIYDAEIGLGGGKVGFGFAMLQHQNGRGGGIAIKAVVMRTWESPVDSFWEDTSFYEENVFLPDRNYAGIEAVVSPLPYRVALGGYKLLDDVGNVDDHYKDFDIKEDDIIWGASLGFGF